MSVKRRKIENDGGPRDNGVTTPSSGRPINDQENEGPPNVPLNEGVGIPGLDQVGEGSDEYEPPTSSQTELESSLPAIQTDNEAVEEYESSRISEQNGKSNLHERLQNGSWQKGRSSIYVDAFNLALETVLDEEAHLFNEAEMEVFRQWKELSYESQYLFVISISMHRDMLTIVDTFDFSFAKHPHGTVLIGSAIILIFQICRLW